MNQLFSKNSLMILESLSFTKTLYAFDFDGTLSKIVRSPADASISQNTKMLLMQLSQFVPVAIVSGRSIDDLKSRVGFRPQYLIGNHGLEGLRNKRGSLDKAEQICKIWKNHLQKIDFGSGVEIEDKTYSLAIHFRKSRNKNQVKQKILNSLATLDPKPKLITGKSVLNILPIGAPHKGAAVLEMMRLAEVKNVFYIGDDDTDEDVFSLPNAQIMSVRVGNKKSSHAGYYIKRQSEINRLIKLLIKFYESTQANNKGKARSK